jgi:hypothetical protein
MTQQPKQCLACQRGPDQTPLVALEYLDSGFWICPLPTWSRPDAASRAGVFGLWVLDLSPAPTRADSRSCQADRDAAGGREARACGA